MVVGLGGADLIAQAAAHRTLGAGWVVDLGLLDLRLGFNSGVAVFAWHEAARGVSVMLLGLAAIVAGAADKGSQQPR